MHSVITQLKNYLRIGHPFSDSLLESRGCCRGTWITVVGRYHLNSDPLNSDSLKQGQPLQMQVLAMTEQRVFAVLKNSWSLVTPYLCVLFQCVFPMERPILMESPGTQIYGPLALWNVCSALVMSPSKNVRRSTAPIDTPASILKK